MRKIMAAALFFLAAAVAGGYAAAAAGNRRGQTGAERVVPRAHQKSAAEQVPPDSGAPPVPAGWKVVKDAKGVCQIAVPENWYVSSDLAGSATFRDSTTCIAVVTSQPGQAFKPMPESLIRLLNIAKDRLFENNSKRIFYQDRVARGQDDTSSYCAMVPAKDGSCSARVAFAHGVPEEVVKKIVLSLSPVSKE